MIPSRVVTLPPYVPTSGLANLMEVAGTRYELSWRSPRPIPQAHHVAKASAFAVVWRWSLVANMIALRGVLVREHPPVPGNVHRIDVSATKKSTPHVDFF